MLLKGAQTIYSCQHESYMVTASEFPEDGTTSLDTEGRCHSSWLRRYSQETEH